MTKILNILTAILLSVSFSFPVFSQEVTENEIVEKIIEESHEVEVVHVSPDDPIIKKIAENPENPNANHTLLDLARNTVRDTGSILIAPVGWSKEQWIRASAIVAGLAILSNQDHHVRSFSQQNRTNTTENMSYYLEKIGNGTPALALLGVSYVSSLVIKNQKLKTTTLSAVESMAVAAVLTTLGKYLVHRERPYSTVDQYQFDGPKLSTRNLSFPSGHTGTAFALATVFAEAYGDSKIAPILAYSAATLAGLSRIHDNKHWATDVLGGAILGFLAGKFVSNRRLLNPTIRQTKIQITPTVVFGPVPNIGVTVRIPLNSTKKKVVK
jgi:membrane-associated phospholipid phosphatase